VSLAVLVGNLGTAFAQAAAATLGYFIFGAPVPLIWGAATLFAALIPLVGPALVWVPMAIVVGVGHGWLRGAGLALYGLLVVSTVDNVVRPLLTKRGLQLHPLLVFVAVFGGMLAFGFVGLFVGPFVIALLITVLEVYERHVSGALGASAAAGDMAPEVLLEVTEGKMSIVYEESVSGRSVIDSTGRVVGEVAGLLVDVATWRIEGLRVKLHKDVTAELGASHGTFRAARLDVPTEFVQHVSDTVVLTGPIGTLRTVEQQPASP
jgi:sporulation protein YlmC with PRC-barrel domain